MTKEFSLLQLFSIVDGRLSTEIGDVFEILNHVCDESLFTYHLPAAMDYLKLKNPLWFQQAQSELMSLSIDKSIPFEKCLEKLKTCGSVYEIPQLKDEMDTSDFQTYMIDNSLLLKKLKQQEA